LYSAIKSVDTEALEMNASAKPFESISAFIRFVLEHYQVYRMRFEFAESIYLIFCKEITK